MARKARTTKKATTSKTTQADKAPAQPRKGGSYIREPDGSLNQVERTATAPIRQTETQER